MKWSYHPSDKDKLNNTRNSGVPVASASSHPSPSTGTITKVENVSSSTAINVPYYISRTRTVQETQMVIPSRLGQGSEFLCAQDIVCVNSPSSSTQANTSNELEPYRGRSLSSNPTLERNGQRNVRPLSLRDKSNSPRRKESSEKLPYFADTGREKDRLRAKYGQYEHYSRRTRTRSRSRSKQRSRSRSTSSRTRKRCRSHSRNRTSRRRYKSRSRDRRRNRSRSRRRSPSRDRHRSVWTHTCQLQLYTPIIIPVPVNFPTQSNWVPHMPPFLHDPYISQPVPSACAYSNVSHPFAPTGLHRRRPPRFPQERQRKAQPPFRPYV